MTFNYHSFVDNELNTIKDSAFFNENILFEPIFINEEDFFVRNSNFIALQKFQNTIIDIFRKSINSNDDISNKIKTLLLNDSIEKFPDSFYQTLDDCIWTTPKFYRTDESKNGKIFEIQCPGSGWGDVILLEKLYKEKLRTKYPYYNLQEKFVEEVKKLVGKNEPIVMHLLDNSSNPSSMRYFIRETSNGLKYWGFDKDVKNSQCNFIRSHSVYGLIAENLFNIRIAKARKGEVLFDLPPLLIFDQKMILCLPFLDDTKHLFEDDIRQTLAYTYSFTKEGFRDIDGTWVSIEEFKNRKPSNRKYFLKYGGCDTAINWGSRAVYRLDSDSCNKHIDLALNDSQINRPWIIQKDCSNKEEVAYLERTKSEILTKVLTAKYSSFYSPSGLLAIRTHHRQSTKVHGQSDSIAGMAYLKI